MDEIDAALDNVNINKISNYIQKRSGELQFVVISLKDIFYEKVLLLFFMPASVFTLLRHVILLKQADALVGIFKDREKNSSGSLTISLSRFSATNLKDDSRIAEETDDEIDPANGSQTIKAWTHTIWNIEMLALFV